MGSGSRSESVVVQNEVTEGHMAGQELDERRGSVETKSVVIEVDSVDGVKLEDSVQESSQSSGDLRQKTTGENIIEVGSFETLLVLQDHSQTLGSSNSQSVSTEADFGIIGVFHQRLDVGIDILSSVELEDFALEGEDFRRGHGGVIDREE